MIVEQFISAGWHTVPLGGELKRLADGKKTTPRFPSDWLDRFTHELNQQPTRLALALTGKINNIIALDCDNLATYEICRSAMPDYDFIFPSKDKPQGGGTIVCEYTDRVSNLRIATEGGLALDVLGNSKAIYLPTEDNHTKMDWLHTSLPELRPIPENIVALCATLKSLPASHNNVQVGSKPPPLRGLVKTALNKKDFHPELFSIITPKEFRTLPEYLASRTLHPNEVPENRGSTYLSQISAIFGADPSIDENLYYEAMHYVNQLWDNPMEDERFKTTIINPMMDGKATINGEVIWKSDPSTAPKTYTFISPNERLNSVLFDYNSKKHFLVDHTQDTYEVYTDNTKVRNIISSLKGSVEKKSIFDTLVPVKECVSRPHKPFGFLGKDEFNLFSRSRCLEIMNNPEQYKKYYKKPLQLLYFMECLIPDTVVRTYLLKFLVRKFTTFDYSQVILYLIGASGSGKNLFVSLLSIILGDRVDSIPNPSVDVFMEKHNGWLINKYMVLLDEYGNKLKRSNAEAVLGQLKAYTGAPSFMIRDMGETGRPVQHSATFILCSNKNKLWVDQDDRRFLFIQTPHVLSEKVDNLTEFVTQIKEEIYDFCYYLVTQVGPLTSDEYVLPPKTQVKLDIIRENLTPQAAIVFDLKQRNFARIAKTCKGLGISDFNQEWGQNRMSRKVLDELFLEESNHEGSLKTFAQHLSREGFQSHETTLNKQKFRYIEVPGLCAYRED